MEHIIYRCKHCKKEYTYCTYGNGPEYGTEKGCTREYCAECANAINEALSKIPHKYEGRESMITDQQEIEHINNIFDNCKHEYYSKDGFSICAVRMTRDWGYKTVEGCYINKCEFYRCKDNDDNTFIYAMKEYDLVNDKFTGKYFFETDNPYKRYFPMSQLKFDIYKSNIECKPMEPPKGDLFYLGIPEWEVITNYNKKEK